MRMMSLGTRFITPDSAMHLELSGGVHDNGCLFRTTHAKMMEDILARGDEYLTFWP